MILALAALGLIAGAVHLARWHRLPTPAEPGRVEPSDGPARIVAVAARLLPDGRREWAHAMMAELPAIDGHARRWRFAAGAAAVALMPPEHRGRSQVAAVVTAVAAVGAGLAAARLVPELQVFTWTLGVLLTIIATGVALRWQRPGPVAALIGAMVVAGVTSTIAVVVAVADDHPAAVSDSTHLYAIAFAVVLCTYLALAPAIGTAPVSTLWWGLGAAAATCAAWLALLPSHATIEGLGLWLWPVGGVAALLASIGAARTTGNPMVGTRAAVTAAMVSAPVYFTLDLLRVMTLHRYTLTSPYDIAQYPHSGFPDVASFVLSDTIGSGIIAVMVMYPLVLGAVGLLGGAIGTIRRRPPRIEA